MTPAIVRRDQVFTTPYFRLIGKHVAGESGDPYYALELPDYVSIVAQTTNGDLVLVKQFRPAVEAVTVELPAGLVEVGDTPERTAIRELKEETGFVAERAILVGCMKPDTGRLANRMWVYFATGVVRDRDALPETGMEVVVRTPAQVSEALVNGTFDHALHVAALLLAVQLGHLSLS